MTDPNEGRTATNAKGEKVVWTNGRFVRAPGAPGAPATKINPNDHKYLISKAGPVAQSAREGLLRLKELESYNDKVKPSGGFVDKTWQGVKSVFGDADVTRFNELKMDLARRSRQVGEGATSDYDAKQFMAMTAGPDKPYASNKAYIDFGRKVFQNTADYQEFSEKYLKKNGNLLGGAEEYRKLKALRPPPKKSGGYTIEEVE